MNTLEKMARAICLATITDVETIDPVHLPSLIDEWWSDSIPAAHAALEAMLEPTEGVIDAPRGLIMYFNSPPGEGYPLGRHAQSGGYGQGYAHLLTDREKRMHSFPKAHQASLVYRAMIQAALDGK